MADVILEAICSKCKVPLLEQRGGNEVAAFKCRHVFHKACIEKWFVVHEGVDAYLLHCPSCDKSCMWSPFTKRVDGQRDLFLEKRDNSNYSRLQSAYKKLEIEKVKLAEEKGVVENERGRLLEETDKLETENSELRKRMITAEIKLTLLTNRDLLEEKFEGLKWEQLTPAFQKELLGKVQVSGRPFMNLDDILPINSKALMRLIKADERDETLLRKIIEDYFQEKKQSNGKVGWEDLDDSLRVYLTSKLRETSQVGSLELEQVPLSSNTLVHLIKDKSDYNLDYLGKIVTEYVDEMVGESLAVVNDVLKVALLELINEEVIGCLEINFLDPQAMESLVEVGMLRKKESEFEAPYEFSQDCVRHYIIGMIMSELMEQVKVSRLNAFNLFYGGYANPLGAYFADYMSEVEKSCLANFVFVEISDNTLANLFMTLCVLRLPSLQSVIKVLKHCNINVLDILLSRKLPHSEDMTLTLLHAAVIRGAVERAKCILYEFGFSKELTKPHFQNLMLTCVENTNECSGQKIQQRTEIIKELVKLNGDLVKCGSPSLCLKVHGDLFKFMVEVGADSWLLLM